MRVSTVFNFGLGKQNNEETLRNFVWIRTRKSLGRASPYVECSYISDQHRETAAALCEARQVTTLRDACFFLQVRLTVLCLLDTYRSFGGRFCLHLQGTRVSLAVMLLCLPN
jgi:hypothetical protein